MELIKKLNQIFSKKTKQKLLVLMILIVLGAFLEMFSVSIVLPLISVIMDNSIESNVILSTIYDVFHFSNLNNYFIFLFILIIIFYVLKNGYLLFMYYLQFKVTYVTRAEFSVKLLESYINKPYTYHVNKNSSVILRNINNEVSRLFSGVVLCLLQLISELMTILVIGTYLLLLEPVITLLAAILIGIAYLIILTYIKPRSKKYGLETQKSNGEMIKWTNQSLEPIKEIKVSNTEKYFVKRFRIEAMNFSIARRKSDMLGNSPRLLIEAIGVIVVFLALIVFVIQGIDINTIIPTLAVFAMAAFRLLPSINRINTYYNNINFSRSALDVLAKDFEINEANNENNQEEKVVDYKNEISLNNIFYKYPNSQEHVLRGVDIKIPFGKSIALIGASGCGKTTIIDVILGILTIDSGEIRIDDILISEYNKTLSNIIGYIPQNINLLDDSIKSNIAFGLFEDEIDEEKVWVALEKAQLKDFVIQLPDGLNTYVGERGMRLSGGQRQRIGIARALYNNPKILIMDEATSALDNKTEKEVVKAIELLQGSITMVIVAHRLSTIENCDIIYEIKDGKVSNITYKS